MMNRNEAATAQGARPATRIPLNSVSGFPMA
jgi:hypothetical protein